jgi:DNA repair protein RadD
MRPNLRPYQEEAVQAIYSYFADNTGNCLIVLPTGSGKSIVLAEFIRSAIEQYPDTRILVLSHVAELLVQNAEKIKALWPEAPVGIYSAGLNQRDLKAQVLVAGIQSISKKAYHVQQCDIVIIDECHLLSPNDNTRYRHFLAQLKEINPCLKMVGLTASPYRLDSGWLHKGDGAMFTDIAYEASVLSLINDGYLSPLVSKATATTLDLSSVSVRGGEFVAKDLAEAVDREEVTSAAVDEIVKSGQDRRSWLVFCSGVAHSLHVRDEIRSRGFSCETITGETPKNERASMLSEFKAGRIRCLTNHGVLTTGVDVPGIDLLAFLRPTKSASLFVQMAGRAMRLSPETGKTNGLILDFANLLEEFGPIDRIKVKDKKEKGDGEMPVKTCPVCETKVFAAARECPECGSAFPEPKLNISDRASALPVLSSQIVVPPPEWVNVTGVSYRRHEKQGKTPSLCVSYRCGLSFHREWICVQHTGFARSKAVQWWSKRDASGSVPDTVDDAVAWSGDLAQPSRIQVRQNGKFTEVVAYDFTEPQIHETTEPREHDYTELEAML